MYDVSTSWVTPAPTHLSYRSASDLGELDPQPNIMDYNFPPLNQTRSTVVGPYRMPAQRGEDRDVQVNRYGFRADIKPDFRGPLDPEWRHLVTRGGRPITRRELDRHDDRQDGMFTVLQQRADFGHGPVDIRVRSARPNLRQSATARPWDSDDSEGTESRPSSVFYDGSSVCSRYSDYRAELREGACAGYRCGPDMTSKSFAAQYADRHIRPEVYYPGTRSAKAFEGDNLTNDLSAIRQSALGISGNNYPRNVDGYLRGERGCGDFVDNSMKDCCEVGGRILPSGNRVPLEGCADKNVGGGGGGGGNNNGGGGNNNNNGGGGNATAGALFYPDGGGDDRGTPSSPLFYPDGSDPNANAAREQSWRDGMECLRGQDDYVPHAANPWSVRKKSCSPRAPPGAGPKAVALLEARHKEKLALQKDQEELLQEYNANNRELLKADERLMRVRLRLEDVAIQLNNHEDRILEYAADKSGAGPDSHFGARPEVQK